MKRFTVLLAVAAAAFGATAETVETARCVREDTLDSYGASNVEYCTAVMERVFERAGITNSPSKSASPRDGGTPDVVLSAFRTNELLERYDFPLQSLATVHFGLYATPARAKVLKEKKITDWVKPRIGYTPVQQGAVDDRERYFEKVGISPEYVECASTAEAEKALLDGKIEALFLYTPPEKRPEGLVEIVPLGDRNIYFAVSKSKPELLKKLVAAYREYYIDGIDEIDSFRLRLLGVPKPAKRVRVAAYLRGDLFDVTPDGERSGILKQWIRSVGEYTDWTLDYVYGGYEESHRDIRNNRLDVIAGICFSPSRLQNYRFPHAPIGTLREFLWTHPDSPCQPGDPATWKGLKVGLLPGSVSAERARRQFAGDSMIECVDFATDREMLEAYFSGEIDACVDAEMPALAGEKALHIFASHPMYICTSMAREDLYEELEHALDKLCDDFPKYMRMINSRQYARYSEMATLSLEEVRWLRKRQAEKKPIVVDFSPWPVDVVDKDGEPVGFPADFLRELSRRSGLEFKARRPTDAQTAQARFMRNETALWIPYPESGGKAVYGAPSVYSAAVPQSVAAEFGAKNPLIEFEMFAGRDVPPEFVSILRKLLADMDESVIAEMFMSDVARRKTVNRVFGLTDEELRSLLLEGGVAALAVVAVLGIVMGVFLRRQAKRAKLAAAAAESHAQAKTRFLAMMSHELRTPLNAVIGFAEFLAKPHDHNQEKEYVNGILLSANALLELINDILDLSKLDAGTMDMRSGSCDTMKLLKELPAVFGYRVRKHGVSLHIDSPRTVPVVKLSQEGMRQVLINLVGNSAKFTDSGEISVRAQWFANERRLHIEVADTGCGISPDKMDKLYDPFVQDIASRVHENAGEAKGTGLGLPIVKRIVDAAHGTISASSAPGEGTVFSIDLPGLEVVSKEKDHGRGFSSRHWPIPSSVLVVDDMTMNRKVLGIHLKNIGVKEVRFAENGKAALDAMKNWTPDLVLTDMWMPEMDGAQLAKAMKTIPSLSRTPAIAITADVDVESSFDMSMFAGVVAKPVTGEKLRDLFGLPVQKPES